MTLLEIWLLIALITFIIEVLTTGIAAICLTVGALFAALMVALGLGLVVQVITFACTSLLAFVYIRPIMLRLFARHKHVKTNADALIGNVGRVVTAISTQTAFGYVQINGDVWQAIALPACNIPVGTWVKVVSREGIILTVTPTSE